MTIRVALCASFALLLAGPTLACTPEEATAKAEQLAAKVSQITQQNPQRAAELNAEMKKEGVKTSAEELPDDCQAYDQRLKELEELGEEHQQKQPEK